MTESKTAGQLLIEAQKEQELLAAKIADLLKQTRTDDLAVVKKLIKTHKFTTTDLKDVLRTRAAKSKVKAVGGVKRKYTRKVKSE